MVVVAAQSSSLRPLQLHTRSITCKSFSPSLLHPWRRYRLRIARPTRGSNAVTFQVKAYMDDSNSISGFANKVIGSLPVIGLLARITSDEGGVGGDIIDFAEFRRRVGKKCSVNDSRAFYDFQDRRGRVNLLFFLSPYHLFDKLHLPLSKKFVLSVTTPNSFCTVVRGSFIRVIMLLASSSRCRSAEIRGDTRGSCKASNIKRY